MKKGRLNKFSSEKSESREISEKQASLLNPFQNLKNKLFQQYHNEFEKKEEKVIMRKLKQNKNWSKISSQIKFKNVIRKVISLSKENPEFLLQMFVIFKHIDRLHEARIVRMTNLKKVMARQIVEQNSLKFEITEKMNNLVNIA